MILMNRGNDSRGSVIRNDRRGRAKVIRSWLWRS